MKLDDQKRRSYKNNFEMNDFFTKALEPKLKLSDTYL